MIDRSFKRLYRARHVHHFDVGRDPEEYINAISVLGDLIQYRSSEKVSRRKDRFTLQVESRLPTQMNRGSECPSQYSRQENTEFEGMDIGPRILQ